MKTKELPSSDKGLAYDFVTFMGLALVVIGLALWSVPLAVVVAGLVFILAGIGGALNHANAIRQDRKRAPNADGPTEP